MGKERDHDPPKPARLGSGQVVILPVSLHQTPKERRPVEEPETMSFAPPGGVDPVSTYQGYVPTEQQRMFLAVAQTCCAEGQKHPQSWVAQYNSVLGRPRVELSTFKKWKSDPKFNAWFYDEITYVPDEFDKALLRGEVMAKVTDGVSAGDHKALALAADILGERKRAKTDVASGVGEEMARFKAEGRKATTGRTGLEMDDEASG